MTYLGVAQNTTLPYYLYSTRIECTGPTPSDFQQLSRLPVLNVLEVLSDEYLCNVLVENLILFINNYLFFRLNIAYY